MLECSCGVDENGYEIWDPDCPRHGAKEEEDVKNS
jgi:hypothetical protein